MELKKKQNLLSILMSNKDFGTFVIVLSFIVWIFLTYFVGKFVQYVETAYFSAKNLPTDIVGIWMYGFMAELFVVWWAFVIITVSYLVLFAICDLKNTIRIAKIIQLLPVSEEELKALNITTYKTFENVILDLFKNAPEKISSSTFDMVRDALYNTITKYFNFNSSKTDDNYEAQKEFAKIRSLALTEYLFKDEKLPTIKETCIEVVDLNTEWLR